MPSNRNPHSVVELDSAKAAVPVAGAESGAAAGLIAHLDDPIDAHDGTAISYDGGPNWADGETVTAAEVDGAIDEIISDLANQATGVAPIAGGASKIGVAYEAVGIFELSNGTLHDRTLLPFLGSNLTYEQGVRADNTLTMSGNFADGETVYIEPNTYTFQATLTDVDGNVQLGGTTEDSLRNLKQAINLTTDNGNIAGTNYAASMTLHPTVRAQFSDATTLYVQAKTPGVAGNTIDTLETAVNGAWAGVQLTGGLDDNTWLDTTAPTPDTPNPATDMKAQIDKVIADLTTKSAASSGADKIGARSRSSWGPSGLTNLGESVQDALQGIIVDLSSQAGTSGADNIGVKATTVGVITNPLTSVQGRLDLLQNAGAIDAGARSSWLGGRTNPDTSVAGAINKIITDLNAQTSGDDGAERIGSFTKTGTIKTSLGTGSLGSQLQSLINDNVHGYGLSTDADTARLEIRRHVAGASRDKSLMIDMPAQEAIGAENFGLRVYHQRASSLGSNDALWLVANASYDNATALWSKDNTTQRSSALVLDGGNLRYRFRASGAGTWADSGWTQQLLVDGVNERLIVTDYQINWGGTLSTGSTGANILGSNGITNALTAKNLVKCWAYVSITGGGGYSISGLTSFNISSTATVNTTSVTIFFQDNFTYSPAVACTVIRSAGTNTFATISSQSTSSVTFEFWTSSGTRLDPTAGSFQFALIAMGQMN